MDQETKKAIRIIVVIYAFLALAAILTIVMTTENIHVYFVKFYYELSIGKGIVKMGPVILLLVISTTQLFTGYTYNMIYTSKSKNAVLGIIDSNNNESFKDKLKRVFKKILLKLGIKVLILAYAIFEFLAFYLLNLLVLAQAMSNLEHTPKVSTAVLYVIIITVIISLSIGALTKKVIIDCLLKKRISKYVIDKDSAVGQTVHDLQMQFCNFAFLLILPLTLLSVFSEFDGVSTEEQALFIGLTSLVIACYGFMIAKSKLYNFVFRPIE